MRYERDLQVRLQERYRRLYKANYNSYHQEFAYFRSFIQKSPALRSITDRIERESPEVDVDKWVVTIMVERTYAWPDTEAGRAKIAWHIINRWANGEGDELEPNHVADAFLMGGGGFMDGLRNAIEVIVEPFVEYLQEELASTSDVLYLLERFVRRVQEFDKTDLYQKYENDTAHGEKIYDTHLRKFLFDQGIDYPFSQPASSSGEADVVSGLDGDDPLVCEVKLYDGGNYGISYIAKGLQQAIAYAHDYAKDTAYLVVFNLSDTGLQLPTDGEEDSWPPRLHVEGVTIYLVGIHAKPRPSASKRGKAQPRVVRRDELVDIHSGNTAA